MGRETRSMEGRLPFAMECSSKAHVRRQTLSTGLKDIRVN